MSPRLGTGIDSHFAMKSTPSAKCHDLGSLNGRFHSTGWVKNRCDKRIRKKDQPDQKIRTSTQQMSAEL